MGAGEELLLIFIDGLIVLRQRGGKLMRPVIL
jgi:hypothetical protein